MPEVARWVNSMTVWMLLGLGMTSPLQVGQLLPQPAPEPLART
jgi:energy-converting hydrogenase Eha subunit F